MLYCSLQDSNPRLPICSGVLPLFTPYERMNRLYSSNLKSQVTVVMIIFERSRASDSKEAHEKWKRCDWWGWRDSDAHCTNFEFVASCLLGYILIYCWRIPNLTSNSVTDQSPFPINPMIFNVDALIGSLFTTHWWTSCFWTIYIVSYILLYVNTFLKFFFEFSIHSFKFISCIIPYNFQFVNP